MRLVLNMVKTAKGGVSCAAIEEIQYLMNKSSAKAQRGMTEGIDCPCAVTGNYSDIKTPGKDLWKSTGWLPFVPKCPSNESAVTLEVSMVRCTSTRGSAASAQNTTWSTCLVLATVTNQWFGSGSRLELNWNCKNRFYHIKNPNYTEPTVFWPVPQLRKVCTLVPIKYLSSNCITMYYIC